MVEPRRHCSLVEPTLWPLVLHTRAEEQIRAKDNTVNHQPVVKQMLHTFSATQSNTSCKIFLTAWYTVACSVTSLDMYGMNWLWLVLERPERRSMMGGMSVGAACP